MDTNDRLHFHFSLSCIGEGNGNPCLEDPRDGGAWWAAVYEVAQSWTRLKRLSSSSNVDEATLMAVSEEDPLKVKTLLMKVKEESEKAGVKLNIKKKNNKQDHGIWSHYFMANRWGNNRNSERLYFPGFKKSLWMVTAARKLKCFLLGRKAMTNLYSLLKSRDITLPTNVCLVKAVVFPVVMYGCESWTINKAEC